MRLQLLTVQPDIALTVLVTSLRAQKPVYGAFKLCLEVDHLTDLLWVLHFVASIRQATHESLEVFCESTEGQSLFCLIVSMRC